MKVTLISPCEAVSACGMRMLSAMLKREGHEVRMIQLPREIEGVSWNWGGFRFTFSEAVLDQVAEAVKDSDLIGITLMSNYLDNAIQITRHLRRSISAPIIWGGVHPTVRPEECLEYADLICIGEGEDALCELAQKLSLGKDCSGIRNIWHKQNNEIIRTPLRPPVSDLDSYPFPDYELNNELVLYKGKVQLMTEDLLIYYLRWNSTISRKIAAYRVFMSRGCRYHCTYCANDAYHKIYGNEWRIRRRSTPNVMLELRQIISRFPQIKYINIADEFFLDDTESVRLFASAYKREIGLPFSVGGFHPAMVDEEKIQWLADAGMDRTWVGVQTGSMRVMKQIYRRPCTQEQLKRTFHVMHKFTGHAIQLPTYQLILDNPWEMENDYLETLRMLLRIPKPFALNLFSLTFYPGTALYERAKQEGLIADNRLSIYRKDFFKSQHTYINNLFRLIHFQHTPYWLIRFLLCAPLRKLNWVQLPLLVERCSRFCVRLKHALRKIKHGDWSPVKNAFRKAAGSV